MNEDALFRSVNIFDVETEKYKIYNTYDGYKVIEFKEIGGIQVSDSMMYFYNYCPEILDLSVDSVLVAGLGLGMVPYYLSDKCGTIDVIEIDQDLIDIVKLQNYLQKNINIICGDAKSYEFDENKKWDCIMINIYYSTPAAREDTEIHMQKYRPLLKPNGFIYMPAGYRHRITN